MLLVVITEGNSISFHYFSILVFLCSIYLEVEFDKCDVFDYLLFKSSY